MKDPYATGGFTLIEMIIATAIVAVGGGMLFVALQTIMTLAAKNSAINLTHEQGRETVNRMVQQLRESVSIPQLVDISRTPLTGSAANGPAAGVSYQVQFAGPYKVWNNANANSRNIRITTHPGDTPPQPGMRLIVPAFQIEDDISNVGGVPGNAPLRDITLANNLSVSIDCNAGSPIYVAYYVQRSALVVVNGELRYYERASGTSYTVVSRNVATAQPFSVPNGDNHFVKIDVMTRDPRVSARGLKAVDLQMNLTVPYRYRLTVRQ